MRKAEQEILAFFRRNRGIVKYAAIRKAGFHPDLLRELGDTGRIRKISRGIYQLNGSTLGTHPDLVLAGIQSPEGVVCLVSALSFHEATTEIPSAVELAIPQGSRSRRIKYPPVRYYRFSKPSWESGIEEHAMDGRMIRVYSLAKTVADCFKFRNRLGIDIARAALKTAIADKSVTPGEILRYAKICRVQRIVKPLLEVLT
jgi:predicted transcriptional regulator of viral defense system